MRESAWAKGVKLYAEELQAFLQDEKLDATKENLLNGASNWAEYSYGGCSLIYDTDIAERLCTPSELKRKRGGELPPNTSENWLDVQTRALAQACNMVLRKAKRGMK